MPWVQIQKAAQVKWADYERVWSAMESGGTPEGLIYHAAGEQDDGRWQSVSIWESEEHFKRFRDDRVQPAVREVIGEEMAAAGPPPSESFEAKHVIEG